MESTRILKEIKDVIRVLLEEGKITKLRKLNGKYIIRLFGIAKETK